jgi:hypothetical protein
MDNIKEDVCDIELMGVSIAPSNNQINTLSKSALSRNTKERQEWRSCCFSINQSAVKYFVQITILSSLIIFSATMLVIDKNCESQRNYGSLLMVCLGCFLPTPKMS